jgi:hypothetical protein
MMTAVEAGDDSTSRLPPAVPPPRPLLGCSHLRSKHARVLGACGRSKRTIQDLGACRPHTKRVVMLGILQHVIHA